MKTKIIIILILVLGTTVYIAINSQKLRDLGQPNSQTTLVTELPPMKAQTLEDKEVSLADFYSSSKTHLVVHFWGSWCAPCISEFPSLMKLLETFKDSKYAFLLVAVDDKPEDIQKFLAKHSIPNLGHILKISTQEHMSLFGVSKVPETFVFNSSYKMIRHFVGPQDWESEYMTNLFKNEL